jgi:hypothetical protein
MRTVVDHSASVAYWEALESLLANRVLEVDGKFICTSEPECRASAEDRNYGFAAGQLSHVGAGYACAAAGIPVRIVVVSMQVGDSEAPVTMRRRATQVAERVPERPGQRNPHMRGVTRALQVLHGLSTEPGDELLADGTHVLEAYAMANSVLCSALPTGGRSRRGKPTAVMLRNCATHLEATFDVLEPTIIHTQGVDTRAVVKQMSTVVEQHSDHVSVVSIAGRRAVLCAASHPAAGPPYSWSSTKPGSHFAEVVAPSLSMARDLALAL